MTQAISFAQLLSSQGHDLVAVMVGKSKRREIPAFFEREIKAPIRLVESPNFECDGSEKTILLGKTLRKNFLRVGTFRKSLQTIHQLVTETQPDVILNFYDLLGGLYNFFFRPKAQFWVIGHQYMIWHPDFRFAPHRRLEKILFQLNTKLTGLGADEVLGLSFLRPEKYASRVRVVPPLLRAEVKKLPVSEGDFYLAYMVNPGYGKEIIDYAKSHPNTKIKAYWDKKDAADRESPLPNLTFYRVNDKGFLEDMAACRGLICTAGFESVCEALYLGKRILVIPVAGQYEQACNALEVLHAHIGKTAHHFDFFQLESSDLQQKDLSLDFRNWANAWHPILENLLTPTLNQKATPTSQWSLT